MTATKGWGDTTQPPSVRPEPSMGQEMAPCRICQGREFWRLEAGGPWTCANCHPPATLATIVTTEAEPQPVATVTCGSCAEFERGPSACLRSGIG